MPALLSHMTAMDGGNASERQDAGVVPIRPSLASTALAHPCAPQYKTIPGQKKKPV
ncbi:MAG: hypothetical protein QNL62_06155 [Gammaproteobacteria bacterium]|nr:hypothetical protein [Gammaproteobacteria bacterium]